MELAVNLGADDDGSEEDDAGSEAYATEDNESDAEADDGADAVEDQDSVARVHHVPVHAALQQVYNACAKAWVVGMVDASRRISQVGHTCARPR